MSRQHQFTFDPDEDDDAPQPGSRRCTPELLLAFHRDTIAATGRPPTLADCKRRFGGLLGPLLDGWELQRRGML